MDYNWISGGFRDELHNIGFRKVDYNRITIGLQLDYEMSSTNMNIQQKVDYNWITAVLLKHNI